MKIPFISGESYEGFYPINCYFLPEGFNGRPMMAGTPGLVKEWQTGTNAEVRGVKVMGEYLYAVVGNTAYLVDDGNATPTAATTTLDTNSGIVQMEEDGVYLTITDGTFGYNITEAAGVPTLTKITDAAFPQPSGLTQQDGYAIVSEAGTYTFHLSTVDDPTTWPADFDNIDRRPGPIVALISDHGEILFLKGKSGEFWWFSGAASFPYERIPKTLMEHGCGAGNSLDKVDNTMYWLAEDWTIRKAQEYTPIITSPPKWNQLVAKYTTREDALAYTYQADGNTFYVLTFPSENITWVLNVATGLMHQWASGTNQGRHRSNCYAYFKGKHIVGDYANGKLYRLDNDTYKDDGETIRWTRTAPSIQGEDRNYLFFHDIEFEFMQGVGLVSGQGEDPKVMLDWSDDNAASWSNELWAGIGQDGEYKNRTRFEKLGSSRNRIFRLSGTDPVERSLVSVSSRISQGTH